MTSISNPNKHKSEKYVKESINKYVKYILQYQNPPTSWSDYGSSFQSHSMGSYHIDEYSFENLEKSPKTKFNRYLIFPFAENCAYDKTSTKDKISVPNTIAYVMMILRTKHEEELQQPNTLSFIERQSKYDMYEAEKLVTIINKNQSDLFSVVQLLEDQSSDMVFACLLFILSQFSENIFPVSQKTIDFCKNCQLGPQKIMSINDIESQIVKRATDFYSSFEDYDPKVLTTTTNISSNKRCNARKSMFTSEVNRNVQLKKKPGNLKSPQMESVLQQKFSVRDICETYFNPELTSWETEFKRRSAIHKLLYDDIKLIGNRVRRNTVRFIIRNLVHLVRRYVYTEIARIRRNTSIPCSDTYTSILPTIVLFSNTFISRIVGPIFIGLPPSESEFFMSNFVMKNILYLTLDRLWFAEQTKKDPYIENRTIACHQGCNCKL